MNLKRHQRGLSFVEIVIGMAIVLLIAGAVIAIWQKGLPKLYGTMESSQLTQTFSGLRDTFHDFPDFAQLNDAMVISNSIVGRDMVSGTSIINRWNQPLTFAPTAHPANASQTNGAAAITDTVPSRVCAVIGKNLSADVLTLTVAGTQVKPFTGTVDLATLGTQCNSATYVPMIFVIGKSAS